MTVDKKPMAPAAHNSSNPRTLGPSNSLFGEPRISVGIMDRQAEVALRFEGNYHVESIGPLSGGFFIKAAAGAIVLNNAHDMEIIRSPVIQCAASPGSMFRMSNVAIGIDFHWERKEKQVFQGNLALRLRHDGTIAVINEINLEDYLESVVSSEMNSGAPREFLKAHSIISRSWLLAALERKKNVNQITGPEGKINEDEVIRWYDREDHDLYDVCADDHCQRYQGVTKIISAQAGEAVRETRGMVITAGGKICDARYSKACGGLTENFKTAWNDVHVPYLTSISDSPLPHRSIRTEGEARQWILSEPVAYCNAKDANILDKILPDFDRETNDFFRWTVQYAREELEQILGEKSGFDFGTLQAIVPLQRGPSGRISRLKITGSKKSVTVGKELEIRRWLSRSHLYSSAFVVEADTDAKGKVRQVRFHGAGWGHGVGLCQIGAAVMASKGFSAEEILGHYFPGTELLKIY
jgi:stage II sporulation protein D